MINLNHSKEDGILMITIPYEKGFSIEVNNEEVEYFEVADAFIGVNVKKGENEIKITYEQQGLKLGILISVISTIICFGYVLKERR